MLLADATGGTSIKRLSNGSLGGMQKTGLLDERTPLCPMTFWMKVRACALQLENIPSDRTNPKEGLMTPVPHRYRRNKQESISKIEFLHDFLGSVTYLGGV